MQKWFNQIATWLMRRRMPRIERFMHHPHQVQEEVFRYLIQTAASTEWGKKYDYAHITSREEFAQRVPVSSYEDLYPQIERVLRGQENVLWPGKFTWFAKSSGTTNDRSKYIPVSDPHLWGCHYRGGKDMICLYVNNYPDTKAFLGKNLGIGGSYHTNPFNPKTYCGDISAVIMKNLPLWAEYLRAPSLEIALMSNWEEKVEKIALSTRHQNITGLSGVPTWTVLLLQRILEITGKEHIRKVWPHLEVFFHGAVSFTPYRELFRQLIPADDMRYVETYNASEGFFAIQDQRDSQDLLLMLDYGIYYEFIPLEHAQSDNPPTLDLSQVQIGKSYAMVISTNSGLWRYKIGDVVRFTSVSPYRIRIVGRTKHYINAFGEELVVENADVAIAYAAQQMGLIVNDYTAAPIYLSISSKGGHEWVVEFDNFDENIHSLTTFSKLLDERLRQINSDYDAKRQGDLALVAPVVHAVPKGTFYHWMAKRGKLGGQHKVPRLSNTRQYLEDLLAMANTSQISRLIT
ncbi:MAG: GH3 auxin-responsive promoter family protein [Bernardetiaceae bacterium]|nr:GH3 auxin-responsive promoter family protein [Bernardetiaceae bacterium]